MHASMLADLASTIALHGTCLLRGQDPIPAGALQQYWLASRKRASRWHDVLSEYMELETQGSLTPLGNWWTRALPILEEILVSDLLTRVYAGIGLALDASAEEAEMSPVLHSVYLSHLEARNRALSVMVRGQGATPERIARLNRLRKTCERWTDLLIGQVAFLDPEVTRYAIHVERAACHADEAADYQADQRQTAGWLLNATMRDALLRQMGVESASPADNEEVCNSVLVCLRPDMFDSHGTLHSLWMHRLLNNASETDCVLEKLIAGDIHQDFMLQGYEVVRDLNFSRRLK